MMIERGVPHRSSSKLVIWRDSEERLDMTDVVRQGSCSNKSVTDNGGPLVLGDADFAEPIVLELHLLDIA